MMKTIPIEEIKLGSRFRKDFGELGELVTSIKEQGLLMPIAVRQDSDHQYSLIAGGRRLAATIQIGEKTIKANVFPSSLSDMELHEAELAENLIRKDMTWAEEVALKKQIHMMMVEKYGQKVGRTEDAPGWDNTKTAKILNTSKSSVTRDLQLASAIETFPDLAKAKNKTEAIKIIEKAQTHFSNAQIAEQLKTINGSENEIYVQKKRLVDKYIIRDCFEGISEWPDNYFDMIEIDPPYGIDFKTHDRDHKYIRNIRSSDYNEIPADQYTDFLKQMLELAFQKIKADGWVLFWHSLHPWYPVLSKLAGEVGFSSNTFPAFWVKSAASNQNPVHNLARNYEPFLYLRRGAAKLALPGSISTFSTLAPRGDRIHPTERPVWLMKKILSTFLLTGSKKKILVPFLGSGNTLLAACDLGHEAVGYDLSEEYRNAFIVRVMEFEYGNYEQINQGE